MKSTVKEYAELKGITLQAVYKAIREGRLETVTEKGVKYITLTKEDELQKKLDEPEILALQREIEHLREQNKDLREHNHELKNDKEMLNQRLQESNIIQLKTVETLKQLEYKSTEIEKELLQERTKTWYQKLFKK